MWQRLFFYVSVILAFNADADCPSDMRAKTVSITLGLDIGEMNAGFSPLRGVQDDANYYKELSDSFASRKALVSADLLNSMHANKQTFLASMQKTIGNAQYVNFNYVGHAVQTANCEWAFVLPSAPSVLMQSCSSLFKSDPSTKCAKAAPRKPSVKCSELDQYIVTASDLKAVFAGKKVFGINDSCFSGAADFGADSYMVNSARGSQGAHDQFGFSQYLKKVALSPYGCALDKNHDGQINFAEFANSLKPQQATGKKRCFIGSIAFTVATGNCPDGTSNQSLGQEQDPTVTGKSGDWAQCFLLSTGSQCQPGEEPAALDAVSD